MAGDVWLMLFGYSDADLAWGSGRGQSISYTFDGF